MTAVSLSIAKIPVDKSSMIVLSGYRKRTQQK